MKHPWFRLFLILVLSSCILAATHSRAASQPNILFILTDDMGWGDLGVFYQNSRNFAVNRNKPAFSTPKLDAMAADGLQMRRHYCPAPVCAPSRASLILGVHQGHANVRDNQFDKALENNHTLATVLKQAGYTTAIFGKWGLGGTGAIPVAHPQYRGFDYFFGYMTHENGHHHYPKESGNMVWDGFSTNITSQLDKCYTPDLWTARAKRWITDQHATNSAKPFFIYLAYDSPHAQLQVPTTDYPAGGGTNGGVEWTGTPGAMINTAVGTIDTWIHPDYTNATWDADNNPSTPEVAWPVAEKRHATMMRRLDDVTADLIQLLKDLGIDNNTLVIFTSDNGPHNEAGTGGIYTQDPTFFDSFGPMDGIKRDSWEGGMREPTLVRWPGHIPAGSISSVASQFHDWLPTFLELAGLPAPARTDGVSLVPTLTGSGAQRSSTIYVEYDYAGTMPNYTEFEPSRRGAVRNQEQVLCLDGYKGIRYNIQANTNDFQIYDTLNDAKETTNLAGTSSYFTNLQQRLKDRILQMRRPLSDAARPFDSDLIPPDVTSNLVAGLDYKAFEGAFPWVPDFTPMTAVTNGGCNGLDLGVRTRNDNIGLIYTGYLNVPADGTYTFYLTADSRAFLRIHDASVIDADYGYAGGTEVSASMNLMAGRHAIRLSYSRGAGGTPALSLQWSNASIPKQTISTNNLLHAGTSGSTPPTAFDDQATTPQNTAVTINVLANDLAGSGPGPLAIMSVGSPKGGTAATNNSGQIVYTPNAGFLGDDTFTYTVSDGLGSATATVHVKVYFTDGLLWFPFNQTSGLTTDEAGGAYTASLAGFTNDPAQWVAGKWNKAIQFDGVANYLSIGNYNGILGSASRTCAAWVKTTSANQMPVIAWGPNVAGNKWTFLLQNGHARIEVTSGYVEGMRLVNDGQWHHVACVFTNNFASVTNAKLYVDGALETSFTTTLSQTVNTTSSGNVKIGSDAQSRYFLGAIDEVRIYNRALSAAEITSLVGATNQSAAAWYRRYYGNAAINWFAPSASGAPRLLDYAMGGQPWVSNRSQLRIQAQLAGNHLEVLFPRRLAGTSELQYTPQVSANLLDWGTLTSSFVSASALPNLPGFEEAVFQAEATIAQQSPLYMRLQVSLP